MDVFTGRILGAGTRSGVRLVVGSWDTSPLGAFADVMVAAADGTRTLLAPTQAVADYIASTYTFDAVTVAPTMAQTEGGAGGARRLVVESERLRLSAVLGSRTPLGRLLRLVPERLATRSPEWPCAVSALGGRPVAVGGSTTRRATWSPWTRCRRRWTASTSARSRRSGRRHGSVSAARQDDPASSR